MDLSIDRLILTEVKRFFRETPQTNWGKNQITKKIDEITEEIVDEYALIFKNSFKEE